MICLGRLDSRSALIAALAPGLPVTLSTASCSERRRRPTASREGRAPAPAQGPARRDRSHQGRRSQAQDRNRRHKDDRNKLAQALLDAAAHPRGRNQALGDREPPARDRQARGKIKSVARIPPRRARRGSGRAAEDRPPPAAGADPATRRRSSFSAQRHSARRHHPGAQDRGRSARRGLAELARLRRESAAERDALAGTAPRSKTSAAASPRWSMSAAASRARTKRRSRPSAPGQALGKQAETVRELIARMEKEIASAARAAETPRAAKRPPPRRWPILPELRLLWPLRRLAAACLSPFREHEWNLVHPTASAAPNGAFSS